VRCFTPEQLRPAKVVTREDNDDFDSVSKRMEHVAPLSERG
jgi:hypothetical protein